MATKKTLKKTIKKASKKPIGLRRWVTAPGLREASTLNDVKNAILLVSLLINAAVFIGWLILRLTTVYDQQVYNFLFVR
ncbi:MAG: hypothetical protein EOT05_02570 [Candidatus Microsaccharimonas sossegonensis]|uniref:Uncharacterized protein n=1 Tax=Candidatus Microsaccharimonas sossegonensis TaxID=2506948 RepID=A0A4Q0AHG1_9BACT|nr:MAG: hypothetical protein EOT05_02570 [Candidatus Microsaccharimonas sossegonensis]